MFSWCFLLVFITVTHTRPVFSQNYVRQHCCGQYPICGECGLRLISRQLLGVWSRWNMLSPFFWLVPEMCLSMSVTGSAFTGCSGGQCCSSDSRRPGTHSLLSDTCHKVVCYSRTGPQILQVSGPALRLSLTAVPVTSYIQSLVRSLIYSFTATPLRTQQSLLSRYSHELLKLPSMNYSAAENGGGWVCSWIHCGPSKSFSTCYSIFDSHVIMDIMREALLAAGTWFQARLNLKRPDWVQRRITDCKTVKTWLHGSGSWLQTHCRIIP